ncbi:MAG: hypothetical protein ACK5HY_07700 [Parahaliea sp.]
MTKLVATRFLWCLIAALPLVLVLGLEALSARTLAAGFMLAAGLRLLMSGFRRSAVPVLLALALLLLALGMLWSNDPRWLRYYPVAVNLTLLLCFALSLCRGPPVVERLARLREPELPSAALSYTRRVTQVWCGFFALNGGAALYTALYSSLEVWALYNGLLAYLLMGALFGGEWLLRPRVRHSRHA